MKTDDVIYSDFSGWADPPTDLLPPLSGDLTCEVAVVGGGVGGMSTALRLAERGRDVVLLDAEFCGHGASSRNAGQLAGAPGGDIQLLNLFFRKKMPGMARLTERAAHHVEDLIERFDIDCSYEPTGNVFAAVSRGQMGRVRRTAKILRNAGTKVELGSSEKLGIPRGFVGGMRELEGGIMNPAAFARGLRANLRSTSARVFEQTRATAVDDEDDRVAVTTPHGVVRASTVVLATNAFAGEWDITPKHLSVPIWVTEAETEPIAPERLAGLGWTSRSGLVTQHNIMENYRLTSRNTIVFGVRRIERGITFPLPTDKTPDPRLVEELARGFATRFPSLSDIAVARAWGGWIAITPTWLPVAGRAGDNVYYSVACNGHGLAQAPYVGALIADAIVDGRRPDDLEVVWKTKPKFPRPLMMSPLGLRVIWAVDRVNDLINGSRRHARTAASASEA